MAKQAAKSKRLGTKRDVIETRQGTICHERVPLGSDRQIIYRRRKSGVTFELTRAQLEQLTKCLVGWQNDTKTVIFY